MTSSLSDNSIHIRNKWRIIFIYLQMPFISDLRIIYSLQISVFLLLSLAFLIIFLLLLLFCWLKHWSQWVWLVMNADFRNHYCSTEYYQAWCQDAVFQLNVSFKCSLPKQLPMSWFLVYQLYSDEEYGLWS